MEIIDVFQKNNWKKLKSLEKVSTTAKSWKILGMLETLENSWETTRKTVGTVAKNGHTLENVKQTTGKQLESHWKTIKFGQTLYKSWKTVKLFHEKHENK